MQPTEELVSGVGRIVNEHVGGGGIGEGLGGVEELDSVAELVHGVEQGGGRRGAGGWTATRALARADDWGSDGVMVGGIGEAIGGLDLMDNVVESLFPHAEWAHRSTRAVEAGEGKVHDDTIKAGGGIAFELAKGSVGHGGEEVVENLGEGSILAFASGFAILSIVDDAVGDLVEHGAAAEENTNEKVEVGLKQVDDPETIELVTSWFLVDHDIDDSCPAVKV